jgi:hypothetical protein
MNERIKELMKQSKVEYQFDMRFSPEKFAELIVRECSGIVQNYMSRWPEDCDLVIKIKEHFGVKE